MERFWVGLRVCFLISLTSLHGCSSGSGGSASVTLGGKVSLGPVSQANVAAYKVNSDGTRGELISQTQTNTDGDYSLNINESVGPVEIVARGGSYEEEASGERVDRGETDEIRHLVPDPRATSEAAITPLTEMATERAKALKERGLNVDDAVKLAVAEIQDAAGVPDISKSPADPRGTQPTSGDADEVRKKYALVLAGLSKMAKDRGVESKHIARALAEDFKEDGQFDGTSSGTEVPIDASALVLSRKDWKEALPAAMAAFINDSSRNTAGFRSDQIPEIKEVSREEDLPRKPPEPPTSTQSAATRLGLKAMAKAPLNTCVPVLIGSLDSQERPTPSQEEVAVELKSSAGLSIYEEAACQTKTFSATLFAFSASRHVFVKAASAGTYTLAAADSSLKLKGGSLTIEFSSSASGPQRPPVSDIYGDPTPTSLVFRGPSKIPQSLCVPASLNFVNSKGMPVPAGSARTVNLVSSNTTLKAYSDPRCATEISTLNFQPPQVFASAFLKASSASSHQMTLTATTGATPPLVSEFKLTVFSPEVSVPELPPPPPAVALELQGPSLAVLGTCAPFAVRQISSVQSPVPAIDANVTVELRALNSNGSPSSLASLHSDPQCSSSSLINQTTIRRGWAHSGFFIKTLGLGTFAVSARIPEGAPQLSVANRSVQSVSSTIAPPSLPAPSQLGIRGPAKAPIHACVPLQIALLSSSSSGQVPIPADRDYVASVSSNHSALKFFAGPDCRVEVQSVPLRAGQPMMVVFVKVTSPAAAIELVVSSPGISQGTSTMSAE